MSQLRCHQAQAAFAVAAATFCPLLVLGIWWPRLTAAGAVAGVVVGLLASVGAIGVDLFLGAPEGLATSLLGQPALWTVPLVLLFFAAILLLGAYQSRGTNTVAGGRFG